MNKITLSFSNFFLNVLTMHKFNFIFNKDLQKKMIRLLIFMGICTIVFACNTGKKSVKHQSFNKNDSISIVNDSTEYELVVFDNYFESWYISKNFPSNTRNIEYYKLWNKRYVVDWNTRCSNYSKSWYFYNYISFDPMDYDDLELQKKLFYYFQYVENYLKIKILYGQSPKIIL